MVEKKIKKATNSNKLDEGAGNVNADQSDADASLYAGGSSHSIGGSENLRLSTTAPNSMLSAASLKPGPAVTTSEIIAYNEISAKVAKGRDELTLTTMRPEERFGELTTIGQGLAGTTSAFFGKVFAITRNKSSDNTLNRNRSNVLKRHTSSRRVRRKTEDILKFVDSRGLLKPTHSDFDFPNKTLLSIRKNVASLELYVITIPKTVKHY